MGRIKLFTVILLPFLVFISCSQSILDNTKSTKSEIEINEDSISKKFYTKNLTKNFTSFLFFINLIILLISLKNTSTNLVNRIIYFSFFKITI